MDDYFAILEVSENVTDDELKKKYKKLAMKYHPDRNKEPGAEEKFKKISAAYDVLSDPQKKQEYLNQRMGNPFGGFNVNPGAGQTFHFNFGMGNPFGPGHPFAQFFDMGGNPHNMRPQQRNIEIVHQIHLEDVLNGKETELVYSVPGIQGSQTVKINIPKGIEHGMKMRFAGAYQQPGFLPSDLYVNIHILPHSRFNREQANLIATTSISVFDAILGSENTITGIDGSTINLVIPAGSQNGQKIKLKGHGLPHFNNNNLRGDLYVVLDIKIPTNLSESQVKYLKEFQNIK